MKNLKKYFLNENPVRYYLDINKERDTIIKENNNRAIVYQWYCKTTEKIYVGSALNGHRRLTTYWIPSILKENKLRIYQSINEYGHDNHYLAILEDIGNSKEVDKDYLISREQYYLDILFEKDKDYVINVFKKARTK